MLVNETNEITYYCSLHHTKKYSTNFVKKNKMKKICLCNGKISHHKNKDKYYLVNLHSEKCDELFKKNMIIIKK